LPVDLIIDDFMCDTKVNRLFLFKLFIKAAENKVVVFILIKEEGWATEMIHMNGGTKIIPLHGNVNNTAFKVSGPFAWGLLSEIAWCGVSEHCAISFVLSAKRKRSHNFLISNYSSL
jgi:hypothetical protein